MPTAYIGLGSNQGDRRAMLDAALAELARRPGVRVAAVSRYWETAAVGGPEGQPPFLNAAAALDTTLSPRELLHVLLDVEKTLGRERTVRWGPRTIDLDLLLHGDTILSDADLTLPHPHLQQRGFVLGPLAEIAPTLVVPPFAATVAELLARLGQRDLQGKRVVVTGSSSGIGKAIALVLAERGADVLIHARQARARAEAVAEEVRGRGVNSHVLLADFANVAEVERFFAEAWQRIGPVAVWINNAGADTLTGANARLSFAAKLELLWQVDVRATMLLSRLAAERMAAAGGGVILNMGWDQAETGMEGDSGELFAAAKGAVMAFTRSLALSAAPSVRVNCLAPGWIRTAWGEKASAAWQDRVLRETPLGRWGTPEDVAQAAAWLVSPAARFLTGQIVRINGGAVR
jgi:2-amino-4-hydroxy-6-hydroxymethyldihydropteridine diphosphokinase